MLPRKTRATPVVTSLALIVGGFGSMTGCENLPGSNEQQGAVAGGAVGAAAGAAIAKDNRLLGALIGGALGAGGGYLIGSNWENITGNDRDEAIQAGKDAEANPATAADVKNSTTADLNKNGYVTLDEVAAMEQAGLTDQEIIRRLRATNQYFELTATQEGYLRDRGVSSAVIVAMRDMSQESQRLAAEREEGNQQISHDR